jgi:hypothetical protein
MTHVWPWQAFLEAPHAAYLVRQHMAASLYDRLSTRPFLTHVEKVFVANRSLLPLALLTYLLLHCRSAGLLSSFCTPWLR